MTTRINNILIGPGKVYSGDPNTALPDESTVAYGASWGGSWSELGLLMNGAGVSMQHSVTMKKVMADGYILALKRVPTEREVGFGFSLLEYTPANLQYVFPDSDLMETAQAAAQKAFADLTIAAGQDNPSYAVGIEAFRLDSTGAKQPVRWRLYEASIEPSGETPFQQGSEATLPVVCMALHNDDSGKVAQLQYVTSPVA